MDQSPTIYGMITTTSSVRYTIHALRSFQNNLPPGNFSFYLIDNDSSFNEEIPLPNCKILRNPSPLGFGANMNQILQIALERKSDALLLNNDLSFSPGWYHAFFTEDKFTITSPLSNREVQYGVAVMNYKSQSVLQSVCTLASFTLEEYLNEYHLYEHLLHLHQRLSPKRYLSVLVLPFFCVKIPYEVIRQVGLFDLSFGMGGGEDYDYALRAQELGFKVAYSLGQFIYHFGGKSSWSGVITDQAWETHVNSFVGRFESKWGEALTKAIIKEESLPIIEELASKVIAVNQGTDIYSYAPVLHALKSTYK
jgi:hypothetical protein